MIGAYACLGGLFAAPVAARAFAQSRPQTWKAALFRAGKAIGYGEGLALLMLTLGVATVNVSRGGRLRLPEIDTLAQTGLLGLTMTIAFVGAGGWFTMRFSPNTARRFTRLLFLVLAGVFYFESARLPEVALRGAAIAGVVGLGMFILLYREVRPQ